MGTPCKSASASLAAVLALAGLCRAETAPPPADYCKMLACDIAGKRHGFLAGNHLYYVGGASDVNWRTTEHETLGFTHPMFRDGRARGHGIADDGDRTGTGHDMWGWEFWRRVRAAYGTVVLDGQRYPAPRPETMVWRPDRQVCTYRVAGVRIEETKFISTDDVLCSILTPDKPVAIEFDGHSFLHTGLVPTQDGDPARTRFTRTSTAAARYDPQGNAIHVTEGGTILTKPAWGRPAVAGRLMYDGLSVVLSASRSLADSHAIRREADGRQRYTFRVECGPGRPVALAFAMGDEYGPVLARVRKLLADPPAALAARTDHLNGLLNRQVPYFRCSDPDVVRTYYYLWSLYFLYFTHTGKGFEQYPHTQTAVNNFMGLHLWDSWAYTAMGAWVADKRAYGFGNVLSWKFLLPFRGRRGALPDNFGIAWASPARSTLVGAVEFAWRQYEQSGDRAFLAEAYDDLFRKLYWDGLPACHGLEINAAEALAKMSEALGRDGDAAHWQAMRPAMARSFRASWGGTWPDYPAGKGARWKDIWHLAALMSNEMPDDRADRLVRRWVMNTETGFLGPVPLDVRPPDCPENGPFAVSTISTWLAVEGMFRRGCRAEAVHCTLGHLEAMVRDHGFPVAPECWDPHYKPWGSMYYNWCGAMVCLLLERLAGVRYSLPDSSLTVRDHLPDSWQYAETRTPIVLDGRTHWARVRVDRTVRDGRAAKRIEVEGCPLRTVIIEPWLEDRELLSSDPPAPRPAPEGPLRFRFEGGGDRSVSLALGRRTRTLNTPAYLTPHGSAFGDAVTVEVRNLLKGTALRYTTDGGEPTASSPLCEGPLTFRQTTTLKLRAFSGDGTVFTPLTATYTKAKLHEAAGPGPLRPGLRYECFEGDWRKLPDFDSLTPVSSGIAETFDLSRSRREERFAMRFSGYLRVPEDGLYRFGVRCDDGCRLLIDGQTVVDLDVLCGRDAWEQSGRIGLKAGPHEITVLYFQHALRKRLDLSFGSEKVKSRPVAPSDLFHRP
ncbi:MAG TPA: PA14 domain-containing protein [Phycisphaerae bacterium]|nr:PA14 domain-containing protein [Phycisphaerae bacterium]